MSRRHDQSYKLLFSIPAIVEQMVRHFLNGDLADELDFERVEQLATERAGPDLVRSHADLLWRIHFRGSPRFLLLPIEFQSRRERYMSVRILHYTGVAYHGLTGTRGRRRSLAPHGLLPPMLAVTIYNGRKRWTAPDDVFDLVEPVRGWLADYQPRLRHKLLDLRALARQPLPRSSVISWIASMELDSSAQNISRVVRRVIEVYPGPEHARLREAFREWVLGAAESWGIGEETLEQVKSLKEADMRYAGVEELKERAHLEGFGQGQAAVVCRLAGLKFGARTADELSRLLEGTTNPERVARISDGIVECETGEELLARARGA